MHFIDDPDNQLLSNNVWTQFVEDPADSPSQQSDKKPPIQSTFFDKKLKNDDHQIDQLFFNFEEQDKKKEVPENLHTDYNSSLKICTYSQVTQNKNVLKFQIRVFLEYHINYTQSYQDQERIRDVKEAYLKICNGDQAKIKLSLMKYLLRESKFNRRNRYIFSQILKDWEIIKKQLFFNGNVKHKNQYLYACKVMRLRCRSSLLSERAQSR